MMSIAGKRLRDLAAGADERIDYSDIPELDATFWENARLVEPDRTVVDHAAGEAVGVGCVQGAGEGQTRMNAVLESYARALLKQE